MVVLKPGAVVDANELIEHAREKLAGFKIPKRVYFVAELPRNTAGKLLKRELHARFAPTE